MARRGRVKDDNRILHRFNMSTIHLEKYESVFNRTSTDFMISAKLIASSTPGMAKARSCIIEPIMPLESAVRFDQSEDPRARTQR